MTLISKNVYIEKLDDIANEYNNTYLKTIKRKPFDFKSVIILNTMLILMIKILNLKLKIM